MSKNIKAMSHFALAKYLSQPLRTRRDYGHDGQLDEYPQQPYANVACPSCGHEVRFKEGAAGIPCPVCSSMVYPNMARNSQLVGEKPYTHEDLVKDLQNKIEKGEIKGDPSQLKHKTPIRSGQGLIETLKDVQERIVPQIEEYVEKFGTGSAVKDEQLPTDFKKQIGIAAKAYSEFYSRLLEIHDLLHRNVKLAQETPGGKDHQIISILEEISETGAKQGFRKLKALGFSQWAKNFLNRAKHVQNAVEGLTFK